MNTFEDYVDEWDELKSKIAELKKQLAPLEDTEKKMRTQMAESVKEHLGDDWKEGMNNFLLQDGRTLKIKADIDRKVEMGEMANAREAYEQLNDTPCPFDDLFRVKYELQVKQYRTLSDTAVTAISRAIVAKPKMVVIELA